MQLNYNIFNILIIFGALQGAVLGVALLRSKRPNRQANFFLGLTLLAFALTLFGDFIQDIGIQNQYPVVKHFLYGYIWAMGPLFYFYVRSVVQSDFQFTQRDWLHFIPVGLEFLLWNVNSYLWHTTNGDPATLGNPAAQFFTLFNYTPFEHFVGICSILIYLRISFRHLRIYQAWLKQHRSNLPGVDLGWLKRLFFAYTLACLCWLGMVAIDTVFFNFTLGFTFYYPVYILFSVLTYWIGHSGYFHQNLFLMEKETSKPVRQIDMPEETLRQEIERLESKMTEDKLYLEPELNLRMLAEKMDLHPNKLSAIINQGFGKSFHDFVNQYRVEEACTRLLDDKFSGLTILGIAFDCGFNSKASFNRNFQNFTNMSPKAFKANAAR